MRTKKFLLIMLSILISISSFFSCSVIISDQPENSSSQETTDVTTIETTPDTQPAETDPIQQNGHLTLMKEGKGMFKIIRAEKASSTTISSAVYLNNCIKSLTGKYLSVDTDYTLSEPDALEILVGNTNREESKALMLEATDNRFCIKTTDTKIIIVASNDYLLSQAVEYFAKTYLNAGDNCEYSDGNIILKASINMRSEQINTLVSVLTPGKSYTSTSTKLYSIAAPTSSIKTPQGGCSDGKYYYQGFIKKDTASNESNNIDRIVKVDIETGKVVKTSNDLALNHCNDITYNSKTKELIVCHNNPNRTKVSIIDPDTLEFKQSVTLPCSIYCIDYNEKHDCYVVGLAGGQSFRFLNSDFTFFNSKTFNPTSLTKGYVTQGVACDDNLIYFVLYKSNAITVYDWDGEFVCLIELNVGNVEPENISICNDRILVSTTGNGATIYEIIPIAK